MAKFPKPGKAGARQRAGVKASQQGRIPPKYYKEPPDKPPKWPEPPPKPAFIPTEPLVRQEWVIVEEKIVKGYVQEDENGDPQVRRIRFPCRRFTLEDRLAAPPKRCTLVYTHYHNRRKGIQNGRKWRFTSPEGRVKEMSEREFLEWAGRRFGKSNAAVILYLSLKTDDEVGAL